MRTRLRRSWRRRGSARLLLSLGVLLIFAAAGILASILPVSSPYTGDLLNTFLPPFQSHTYPLGTDELGRSELARITFGIRPTLFISLGSAFAATIGGLALGILSVYGPATVRLLADALVDIALTFPGFVLAIALVSVLGPTPQTLILAVALTSVGMVARLARGEVLRVRGLDYVLAAQALGVPWMRVARTSVR